MMYILRYLTITISLLFFSLTRVYSQQDSSDNHFYDSIEALNQELLNAAFDGDEIRLAHALKNGADINCRSSEGVTALMFSAQNGFTDIVIILLHNGANVNLSPDNGITALISAVQYGRKDICNILIDKGADINSVDNAGRTALIYATAFNYPDLDSLLLDKGASVNLKSNDSIDALMIAAYSGYTDICRFLIEKGADVNSTNDIGFTPLMFAVQNGYSDVVKLLLDKGARVNYRSHFGTTSLMLAVESGQTAIIDTLLKRGSLINDKNRLAESPYKISILTGQKDITRLLKEKGAEPYNKPIYNKGFIGFGFYCNNKDLIFSGLLGLDDIHYNTTFYAGFDTRYWGKRVLLQKYDSLYYQLWEKRYSVVAGADKKIAFHNGGRTGIFAGFKVIYTFGGYKGSEEKISERIIPVPRIGIYRETKNFGLTLNYEYSDFGIYDVSPHKISLGIKYLFFLKKYKYQYKNISWRE